MAHITADRVRQTTTSVGTGSIVLSGSLASFRDFSAVLAVSDTFWYAIASYPGSEWEVGLGTYTSASTFTRTTVLSSSNAGAAVTFSAGTKEVFITSAAGKFLQADASSNYLPVTTNTQALGSSSLLWSNVYSTKFVSSNTSAQSLTDGAVVLNGASGSILLDDSGHKRISWNDGAGNLNIRAGNYYNGTAVVYAKGSADANGGSAGIHISTDAVDGVIAFGVSAIGVPAAAVTYTKNLTLSTAGLTFDGNFTPLTTNSYTLGSSGLLWSNVYATTFTGALTGNASGSAATFTSTTQNSQFNSIGVNTAASGTAGQINAAGIIQANKGIKSSDSAEPTYKINWDSGVALGGTWWKIVTVALAAATQYSTQGFKITLTDAAANHATQGSADSVAEYVYYVACVRSESTTIDTPDLCLVRGPSTHIRAVKTSTGNYEIQVQPLTQYREYIIEIETYASNAASSHTITFSNGTVAGSAGIATYSASATTGSLWVQKLKSVNGISLSEPGSTGDRLLLSTSTSGAIINQNHASSIFLQNQGTNRLVITPSGEVGVGTAATTAQSLGISRSITGGTTAIGLMNNGAIQADVTGAAWLFRSSPSVVASAFTLPSLAHFSVVPGTLGASSTITNEYGALFQSTMVNATTTYGVSSNIVAQVAGGTAVATATSISQTGTTVTVNATAHGFVTGQYVTVAATANATALTSGAWVTILTVGTTDFTLIGAASNTVGVSFTANAVTPLGTGTVTLNAQGSGKNITFVDANTFTYTTTSATYTAITLLTGVITPAARWNIYAGGTAPNYFAGAVGIGSTAITNVNLRLGKTMTGSTTSYGIYNAGVIQSDVTAAGVYNQTVPSTVGAVTNIYYNLSSQGTFGGAVTNQYGFNSGTSLIGATNNYAFIAENTAAVTASKVAYGFFSNINTATGGGTTYNFYANGTATNYFAGNVGIGTASPASKLEVQNGFITAGTATATNGAKILGGYYTSGSIATWGSEYSNGSPVMGYGVWPSTSAASAFVSSTAIAVTRGAYMIVGNNHKWFIGEPQTVAIDSAVTTSQAMTLNGFGNLGIGIAPSYKLDVQAGALDTTLNSQLIISRFNTTNTNASSIEISNVRDSAGTDWTTTGSRIQQKIDSTWMGWIQFNGTGNQQGISFGTGGSTVNALGVAEKLRIDINGHVTPGTTNTQTLGAVGDVWSNVHATTFTGALSGAASSNVLKTGDTMTGALTIQSVAPILNFFETDQTLPAGRRRLVQDGNAFSLRRNTILAGDFSTEVYDFNIDASGNFAALGTVTGTRLISNIAQGTAPLTVTSTTLVTNLNADLLDGLNSATANTVSTIVARDASGNFSAGTITATLTGSASGNLPLSGGTLSGPVQTNIVAVAALDINCSLGNYFTKTISANSTFTFSSVPTSTAYSFVLELTHTSGTVTWPTAVQWPAGNAPSLTTGKTHLFVFVTDDGGTRWRGSSSINYTT